METRFGEYAVTLPEGARVHPSPGLPWSYEEHGVRTWRMRRGDEAWTITLNPGGELSLLKDSIHGQTRIEVEPDAITINDIPGVYYASRGDWSTSVDWYLRQGVDLIQIGLRVDARLSEPDVASRAQWVQTLRHVG